MHHERLVNEATFTAAERLLDRLPVEQRRTLEGPVHQAIRDGILLYAKKLATVSRQLDPLGRQRTGR